MKFNHSQEAAIRHTDGPLLVLAGPGSGKTTVITHRIINLIENHEVPPEQILVITFTRAAAGEMKARYQRLTDRQGVTFGTFHAVYFMMLKAAYHFQASNILDPELKYQIMRDILHHYRLDYEDEAELMENLFDEISKIKTSGIEVEHYYSTACGESVFRDIFRDYQRRLHENRRMDFDDILLYTHELLSEREDILAAWQKRYRYLLVDEFQDINRIQYEILRMLALPENNLFIVGDDDQSIYRFRGANPEIMLSFEKQYPNAGRIVLETNYRSTDGIIEASGALIAHNTRRFDKKIRGDGKPGEKPQVLCFEDPRRECLFLIRKIQEGIQNGLSFSDFAVLFRTNTQPGLLMELLMEYNLPYQSRDRMPNLYEHWICEDVFAYFRLSQGSMQRKDFLRIINRPKRYISRDSLTREHMDFEEWKEEFRHQPWIAERIGQLECDLAMLGRMNPYAAVNYIRRGIGYDDFIREYAEYKNIGKDELFEVLDRLQESARGFATFARWEEHIADFKKELRKQQTAGEPSDGILLATLHRAKGLEFHTVFLLDVNEGVIPYKKALLDAEIEEERRLFYVGMTRAKEQLYLCAVSGAGSKKTEPSRFLKELD